MLLSPSNGHSCPACDPDAKFEYRGMPYLTDYPISDHGKPWEHFTKHSDPCSPPGSEAGDYAVDERSEKESDKEDDCHSVSDCYCDCDRESCDIGKTGDNDECDPNYHTAEEAEYLDLALRCAKTYRCAEDAVLGEWDKAMDNLPRELRQRIIYLSAEDACAKDAAFNSAMRAMDRHGRQLENLGRLNLDRWKHTAL